MGKKIEYASEQILCEKTKVKFIRDIEIRNRRRFIEAKCQCGKCGKIYEGRISHAKTNYACLECRTNKDNSRILNPGDIITANNNLKFLFLENRPSKRFKSRITRYGLFILLDKDNNKIGIPFEEQISHIKSGKYTGLGASIGELKCQQALQELGLKYHKEFIFDDLINPKTKAKLRFDFMVQGKDNIILLELDGPQYFKAYDFFGGEQGLKDLKYRDKLKNDYCFSHGYTLYRIHYTEYDKISALYISKLLQQDLEGGKNG